MTKPNLYDIMKRKHFYRKVFDMICNTILDAIGNTPIIRLRNMTGPDDAEILAKFEGLNVGGSIKTRTALNMINHARTFLIL